MPEIPKDESSQPVEVTNANPLPVEVQNDEPLRVRTERDKVAATRVTNIDKALASAKVDSDAARFIAAEKADILRTDDQRRISGMWERTQQVIALSVVEITMMTAAFLIIMDVLKPPDTGNALASRPAAVAFVFMVGAANLVIGFYFGRTNHQKVGGISTGDESARGR